MTLILNLLSSLQFIPIKIFLYSSLLMMKKSATGGLYLGLASGNEVLQRCHVAWNLLPHFSRQGR